MKFKLMFLLLVVFGLIISPVHAKKDNSGGLPPGLEKNVRQGKPLPPGWHKKLAKGQILDPDIYHRGVIIAPLDPLGIVTIRIEDKVFRVMEKSREIVDILHE
ncbi:MAG: hypothetical protein RQ753_08370 [Desulfurivibrionaceae bacterium]|nr:hypothetical protein [Desulfurivibrionaceae bacterium]